MKKGELDRFKKEISLTEFAASRGYALDRRESSQNSAIMRHADSDKIVIARNAETGDWIYFSIRNHQDNGTIIDFLQNRSGGTLGEIRKTLRSWTGSPLSEKQLPMFARKLIPIPRSRGEVIREWEQALPCFSLPSLTARGIGRDILALPRFVGRVRVDERNNALFPHYDKEGLSGFEIKNRGFTGFARGGVKGLWYSKAEPTDRFLLLTESAIDALSHQALHPQENQTRFMSTGGEMNPQQPALLRGAMEKLPPEAVVLLAFDCDEGGEKLTEEVKAIAPAGRHLQRIVPNRQTGKDWNDELKHHLGLK